jgi:hypothetical protein
VSGTLLNYQQQFAVWSSAPADAPLLDLMEIKPYLLNRLQE